MRLGWVLLAAAALCGPAAGARARPRGRRAALAAPNRTGLFRGAPSLSQAALGAVSVRCGVSVHAGLDSSPSQRCPRDCPLWAETHGDDFHCNFKCVPASVPACSAASPHAPIPDESLGICRTCMVTGCLQCAEDGSDACARCSPAYTLSGGQCLSRGRHVFRMVLATIGVLLAVLVWWLVHLVRRPVVNRSGERRGLAARSRAKLLMSNEARRREASDGSAGEGAAPDRAPRRGQWPLSTNLLRESVAGPGLKLHFHFQWAVILWAAGVAVGWALLALAVDPELLTLGTEAPGTPRDSCVAVAQGYEAQHRLMRTKVRFVLGLYVASSLLAFLLAVRQLRSFQRDDVLNATHKDYCAVLTGLPALAGSERVEEELQQAVQEAVGPGIVGVSVCWDFGAQKWTVMSLLEEELRLRDSSLTPRLTERSRGSSEGTIEEPQPGCQQRFFSWIEQSFFSPRVQRIITKGRSGGQRDLRRQSLGRQQMDLTVASEPSIKEAAEEVYVEEVLSGMCTSDTAFVIFETQAERDAAVLAVAEGDGLTWRGCVLRLKAADVEPNSLLWQNCEYPNFLRKVYRTCVGTGALLMAMLVWVGAFYLPYAIYAVSFNYKYGMEPHFLSSLLFSMIVVAGNAVMYVVCGEIANYLKFRTVDSREVCYMMLYTFACVMNVMLDLVVTYRVAYSMMVGMNMHTFDGKPLAEVHTFMERFKTYAMQRELGEGLWEYAFPSTFLLPFVLEPIFTVFLPYQVARLIVRSNRSFDGAFAESCLESTSMDLSRYGDVLLNVILAVSIFFFPGGYTAQTFAALVLSHLFIYAYDQFRALRCVQAFHFADMNVDWWAQWMLSLPCGLLLACAALKANCKDGQHCLPGEQLIALCTAAFTLHVALHTLVLVYAVPCFGLKDLPPTKQSYRECGERIACSFFNANPVFCLRSKFVYEHEPQCDFCVAGKEHLLRVNRDIGQHFHDVAAAVENYDLDVKKLSKQFTSQLEQSWRLFTMGSTKGSSALSGPDD